MMKPKIETDYKKRGRKTKLNKTLIKQIKPLLKKAIFDKYVYEALQISHTSWSTWKNKAVQIEERIEAGEEPRSKNQAAEWAIFVEFLATVRETRPKVTIEMVGLLQRMAKTNFQALKFYLQTVGKEEFGEADTFNLKHTVDEKLLGRMREAHRERIKEMEEKEA
ncbi:MAG TPA: hypothetical protein ENH82_00875 [bacterium]|nr:hypothetical protein [bacterium]